MELASLTERVERVSAGYAAREGFDRDDDWFLLKLMEEVGELTQVQLARTGRGEDRGWDADEVERRTADEVADVLGHVLLLARRFGVDVETAMDEKWLQWERSYPAGPALP
ncbi:MazG-like family protein [Amnibacterium kyonggiense]